MRADEYGRALANLRKFLDVFSDLIAELEPIPGFGAFPQWKPRAGHENRANELRVSASLVTGPAARALDAVGVAIDYKPPGTMSTMSINPVLVWSTIFDPYPVLEPRLVQQAGLQALGLLEHLRDEQAGRETGVIGLIAWFLTIAPRVRDAAGLPPRSPSGTVVMSLVVIAQSLVLGVIASLIAIPIAKLLGWQ